MEESLCIVTCCVVSIRAHISLTLFVCEPLFKHISWLPWKYARLVFVSGSLGSSRPGGSRVHCVSVIIMELEGRLPINNDEEDNLFAGLGGDDQEEIQWEPVELPTKLADCFKETKAPGPVASCVEHLKDPVKCTPFALLANAVFKDHPEKYFPPPFSSKRKRSKGPDNDKMGRLLHQLQINPYARIEWDMVGWNARRQGSYEYHRDFREITGLTYYEGRKISSEHWTKTNAPERLTWAFLGKIRSHMYNKTKTGNRRQLKGVANADTGTPIEVPQSDPDPLVGQGFGLLRTHHTDVHNQNPDISQIMILDQPLAHKLKLLSKLPCLTELHKEHSESVTAMAKEKGFPTYATTMEICMNSKDVGRIHLHDFMGCEVTHGVDDTNCRKVDFRLSDLRFRGIKGHSVFTRGRGINRIRQATAQGLYYVVCDKIGTILTTTSRQPFED